MKTSIHKFFQTTETKFLSYILCLALLATSLPLGIFAGSLASDEEEAIEVAGIDKYTYELTDRRDEYSKHFHNPDGTNTAVSFAMPVHRQNEDGEWVMIDNTLLDASANEYATSDARIKFAKKTTGNEVLFTLHDGNYKITMSLDGANKKIPGIITNYEADENADEITKLSQLNKLNSSIRYNGILDGIDLEYIASSNSVKENIIVNQPLDGYTFTFTMKLNNLSAEMAEDGGVVVMNEEGTIVYRIAPPYMYDADDNLSMAVSYSLAQIKNKEYALTVTANEEWINSPERVFPVTIDPSVSPEDSAVTDLWIILNSNNNSAHTTGQLYLGSSYRLYWKTSILPTLPYYAVITNAAFKMTEYYNSTSTKLAAVGIHNVISDWSAGLTYSQTIATTHHGKIDDNVIDYQKIETTGEYTWNITDLVRNWYSGTTANYGVSLQHVFSSTAKSLVQFRSNDYSAVDERPRLMITYKDQFGLEDYWTYFTHNAGLAGVASVNLANGYLIYNTGTLTTTDSLMPFTPTLVYNAKLDWGLYTRYNREVPYSYATIAGGWQTNMNQSIVPRTRINQDGVSETYYIYNDADGTYHSFFPSTSGSNIYYDEDGLKLELTVNSNNYVITDASYNTYTFTKKDTGDSNQAAGGFLQSITDPNGNKVSFSPNTYGRPQSVKMTPNGGSAITQLNISYNTKGVIRYIYNSATNQGVFLYYSNDETAEIGNKYKFLRRIVYAHADPDDTSVDWATFYTGGYTTPTSNAEVTVDAVCEYEYDPDTSRLIWAYDGLNQIGYEYTYNDTTERLISIQQKVGSRTSSTLGQKVTFTYGVGYTQVRTSGTDDVHGNSDDILTNYQFDSEGRCISSYSTDASGYTLYGASTGEYEDKSNKAKNNLKHSAVISDVATNYLLNGNFEQNGVSSLAYWSATGDVTTEDTFYNYYAGTSYSAFYDSTFNVKMKTTGGATAKLSQTVQLLPGTYTFSVDTLKLPDTEVRVYLQVDSQNAGEEPVTETIVYSKILNLGDEAQGSITFKAEGTTETFDLSIIVESTDGKAHTVNINKASLVNDVGGGLFSRVAYGSFESSVKNGTSVVSISNFWKAGNIDTDFEFEYSGSYSGTSLHILENISAENLVTQTIFKAAQSEKNKFVEKSGVINLPNKRLYRVSGMAKYFEEVTPNGQHEIRVEVVPGALDANGNYTTGEAVVVATLDYNTYSTGWQFLTDTFIIPGNMFVDEIRVICDNSYQPGSVYFDDISVCYLATNEESTHIEYMEETGNPKKVQSGDVVTWYRYDSTTHPNSPTAVITNRSATVYEYDSNHNVYRVSYYDYVGDPGAEYYNWTKTSATGKIPRTVTTYGYNSYGQQTDSVATTNGTNQSLTTSNEYYVTPATDSRIFGALKRTTNNLGQTTNYYYDSDFGYLLAVIGADGNGTTYTYDALGRMDMVLPANTDTTPYEAVTSSASVDYSYDAFSRLNRIVTETMTYNLTYDVFGNTSSVSAGSLTLASYTYHANNGKLKALTYGNGHSVRYVYDELDRIKEVWYNTSSSSAETLAYTYAYDADGNIHKFTDYVGSQITWYKYDHNGRLREYYVTALTDSDRQYSEYYEYDAEGRITGGEYTKFLSTRSVLPISETGHAIYTYCEDGSLDQYWLNYGYAQYLADYDYDIWSRLTTEAISVANSSGPSITSTLITKDYEYYSPNGSATGTSLLISGIEYDYPGTLDDGSLTYTYDEETGFITAIHKNGSLQSSYEYDDLGQLTREINCVLDKNRVYSYVYTYDNAGNIDSKKTYDNDTGELLDEVTYDYDSTMGDLLTSYDGVTISYESANGVLKSLNPTNWKSPTDDWSLTWTQGRRLSGMVSDNFDTVNYTYNADGIRTSKTYTADMASSVTHTYTLSGSTIIAEEWTENGIDHTILYLYDAKGTPIGMRYTNSNWSGFFENYLYVTNLQGDIIHIYDDAGKRLVTYNYDAWGNHTITYENGGASTAAQYNPFRYRGYYYDVETGFYYLNSRYYDPQVGRFINADTYVSTGQGLLGNNMFAYCLNNPTNYVDSSGKNALLKSWAGAMWWLCGADTVLPIGDIVYGAGIVVIGLYVLAIGDEIATSHVYFEADNSEHQDKGEVTKDNPPTEKDGYIAPKGGPKKGKTKDGKTGWVDKYGNIWVPAPSGSPSAHGGGHWDVTRGDGKGYINVYPEAKIRTGGGKRPHLPIDAILKY